MRGDPEQIVGWAAVRGVVTSAFIQDKLDCSAYSARALCENLVHDGLLERTPRGGSEPWGGYQLTQRARGVLRARLRTQQVPMDQSHWN